MKLIDRYLLKSFLVPLFYCLAAFTLVYVIFDLFDNLSDFIDGKTPVSRVSFYYAALLPTVLVYIVPVSLLLAVLASLSSLTKNNELTAMRASGVSLMRLMLPYVLVGLMASLIVLFVNESIGPTASYWCKKFISEQKQANPDAVHTAEIAMNKETAGRIWYIREYDTRSNRMRGIEVTQRREDGSEEYKMQASEGQWLDGYWVFTDLNQQFYDLYGNPRGLPKMFQTREMYEYTEKPVDFLSEVKPPEFMSSAELIRYIRMNESAQPEATGRRMVDLHFRLAQPWTCFVVTLLGIPFGNQTGRKGALRGFILSLGLFFGYYAVVNFGLFLGKDGALPAWIAGWLPHILFLPLGLFLVYRIR
ncbi:MAG: LptF/LptG family permease [Kiritimatiellia bacterium]